MRGSVGFRSIRNHHRIVRVILLGGVFLGLVVIAAIMYARSIKGGFFYVSTNPPALTQGHMSIAEHSTFDSPVRELFARATVDGGGISYVDIPFDEILEAEGQYKKDDQLFLAYRFFITNDGRETLTVDYDMRLTQVTDAMDQYIRILVIEDGVTKRMYQKPDQLDQDGHMPQYEQPMEASDFLASNLVFRETFEGFRPGEVKSFVVILWVEAQDPDLGDWSEEGDIIARMSFDIRDQTQTRGLERTLMNQATEPLWMPYDSRCVIDFHITHQEESSA